MNVSEDVNDTAGFAPEEIITSEPTRSARLKWVIVADESIPAGLMVNAVACIAASTAVSVAGLIGPGGRDASGHRHPGLPWAGCTALTATAAAVGELRQQAVAGGMAVVDMPRSAQTNRVYDHYLAELAQTKPEDLAAAAISIIGPRNRISRLVRNLELLR